MEANQYFNNRSCNCGNKARLSRQTGVLRGNWSRFAVVRAARAKKSSARRAARGKKFSARRAPRAARRALIWAEIVA